MVRFLYSHKWKYFGPIFDAHTHIWNTTHLKEVLAEQASFGIKRQIVIVHSKEVLDKVVHWFPNDSVFAKYLSTADIIAFQIEKVVDEIRSMRVNGFSLAKMWAAPAWRNYIKTKSGAFHLTDPRLKPLFETLIAEGFPLLLHVGDPDTYYATTYANSAIYGTKEEHLHELKQLLTSYPDLQLQLAHFAAQPEIPRLDNLAKWFDEYPNFVIDTASSRWMARELSRNPDIARKFLIKYSTRVLFGTDATLNRHLSQESRSVSKQNSLSNDSSLSPYMLRLIAQRILWETNERNVPLPFPDPDTEAMGGTFINGLNLPKRALDNLYWQNAQRLYPH